MAPHSSTLAWKIPWMEEPGRLQPMESQRVGHGKRLSSSMESYEQETIVNPMPVVQSSISNMK